MDYFTSNFCYLSHFSEPHLNCNYIRVRMNLSDSTNRNTLTCCGKTDTHCHRNFKNKSLCFHSFYIDQIAHIFQVISYLNIEELVSIESTYHQRNSIKNPLDMSLFFMKNLLEQLLFERTNGIRHSLHVSIPLTTVHFLQFLILHCSHAKFIGFR